MQVFNSWAVPVLIAALAGCSSNAPSPATPSPEGGGSGSGGAGGGGMSPGGTPTGGGAGKPLEPAVELDADKPCGLSQFAFCETFDKASPGGRGGDLDETRMSFSRWGHFAFQAGLFQKTRAVLETDDGITQFLETPSFCNQPINGVDHPDDVRICAGKDGLGKDSTQLHEVLHDAGGFAFNSMMIRQPFDFTNRTGTIVFDVDAKVNFPFFGHGWWIELWVTEDPAPMPYHGAPTVGAYPRNGVGFVAQPGGDCIKPGLSQFTNVVVVKDHKIVLEDHQNNTTCFKSKDGVLNRFKVVITTQAAEIWGTDWDAPGKYNLISKYSLAGGLPFSKGYVHLQHAQYNANKERDESTGIGVSPAQTFRWDNIGFDGPTVPALRGYEVPDSGQPLEAVKLKGKQVGYYLDQGPVTLQVENVALANAKRAFLNFNYYCGGGDTVLYRLNGAADFKTFTAPSSLEKSGSLKAFSVEVPLDSLVEGTNSIEFKNGQNIETPIVGNIDISVEASK